MSLRSVEVIASLLIAVPMACGGNGSSEPDASTRVDAAASTDASNGTPGTLTLTSTAFENNGLIPGDNTCMGNDLSPQLSWSGAPVGTASFAIVMTDVDVGAGLIHWIAWDIPPTITQLAEGVETSFEPSALSGGKQSLSYDGQTRGYAGPCPPAVHEYEFSVYALHETTLGGLDEASTRAEAKAAIVEAGLAQGTLTGFFPGD